MEITACLMWQHADPSSFTLEVRSMTKRESHDGGSGKYRSLRDLLCADR